MIARTRARTGPCAKDLANLSGVPVDRLLRSVHCIRLACAYCRDARSGKAAWGWGGSSRNTALEGRGARAQACEGAGAACVLEAAVASAAAGGFGAASDVVREAGAGVQDIVATVGGAIRS